jgi:ornithine carbamoyltransferase
MDFLSVTDLGPAGLAEVLATAAAVKADPAPAAGRLAGRKVGLFFEKPSTRTRVSCEVAVADLGAVPLVLKQDEVGLGKRESVADVARTLDRYLDVLAFRVFRHGDLVTIAEYASAPVINLLSDLEHPCQALADLQTLAESRPLAGATVAFLGDGNNVCHSLVLAGAMSGWPRRRLVARRRR